jgi:hypothetical protein
MDPLAQPSPLAPSGATGSRVHIDVFTLLNQAELADELRQAVGHPGR